MNLLEILRDRVNSVQFFIYDFAVPFTNNLAGRRLKIPKVKMIISGYFRSFGGTKIYARNRSYLSMAAQNGLTSFYAIGTAFNGQPDIPKNHY